MWYRNASIHAEERNVMVNKEDTLINESRWRISVHMSSLCQIGSGHYGQDVTCAVEVPAQVEKRWDLRCLRSSRRASTSAFGQRQDWE